MKYVIGKFHSIRLALILIYLALDENIYPKFYKTSAAIKKAMQNS